VIRKVISFGILFSLLLVYTLVYTEEYIAKAVLTIPFGEADSLLGFIPPVAEIGQNGDTLHFELGEAASSWDVQGGKFYVVDGVKANILVYDLNGKYIKSIGKWREETDEVEVKAVSGKIKKIKPSHIGRRPNIPGVIYGDENEKKYFERVGDIAVDGNGNIYVTARYNEERDWPSRKGKTYTASAYGLMKFSPEGKLLEIIDKFGEYGPEEIRDTDILFSDAYGNVGMSVGIKPEGSVFVEFDSQGRIIYMDKKNRPRRDGKGLYYEYKPLNNEKKIGSIDLLSFYVKDMKRNGIVDSFYILTEPQIRRSHFELDGEGNLYFDVGWALHKYDQKGNLLAIINPPRDTVRTFKHPMGGMGTVSKIMANGDIYYAYMSDQGFVVVKQELQPETKGQILRPAVKPEK